MLATALPVLAAQPARTASSKLRLLLALMQPPIAAAEQLLMFRDSPMRWKTQRPPQRCPAEALVCHSLKHKDSSSCNDFAAPCLHFQLLSNCRYPRGSVPWSYCRRHRLRLCTRLHDLSSTRSNLQVGRRSTTYWDCFMTQAAVPAQLGSTCTTTSLASVPAGGAATDEHVASHSKHPTRR